MADFKEGWNYLVNSPKWHYFRDGRSLCRRWGIYGKNEDSQQGNNGSPDNCKACRTALEKELVKKGQLS